MLDAEVNDNFILGFDGQPRRHDVYVATAGHTWTLSPTLILDGNFGANIQNQTVTGPGLRHELRPRPRHPRRQPPRDIRASGLPTFENGYTIGSTPNWMPLFRKERSFTSARR